MEDAAPLTAGDQGVGVEKEDGGELSGDNTDLAGKLGAGERLSKAFADPDTDDQRAVSPEVVTDDMYPSADDDTQLFTQLPLINNGVLLGKRDGPAL